MFKQREVFQSFLSKKFTHNPPVHTLEKVQTHRGRQPTQKKSTEEECVLVGVMVRGQVVEVEEAHPEHGPVHSDTHVQQQHHTQRLYEKVVAARSEHFSASGRRSPRSTPASARERPAGCHWSGTLWGQ